MSNNEALVLIARNNTVSSAVIVIKYLTVSTSEFT